MSILRASFDSKGNPKLILYTYRYLISHTHYYRWIVLLLYCFSNIAVGITMMSFGTIAPKIAIVRFSLSLKQFSCTQLTQFLCNFALSRSS